MTGEDTENALSIQVDQPSITVPEKLNPPITNSVIPVQNRSASTAKLSSSLSKPSIIYFLYLFYAFLCMGFGTGITSSTLLKLGEQTNSTIDQLTSIFFTRSCGFFSGTTLAGLLVDRFHNFVNMFLAIAVLMMSVTTLLIPFIYRLILLLSLQLVWGLGAGIVENVTQVLTMRYYSQQNVGPYLQALHSAFGIGAFVSPLIVAPLVSNRSYQNQWHYAYFIIFFLQLPDLICLSCHSIRDEWYDKSKAKSKITTEAENEEFLNDNRFVFNNLSIESKAKPVKRQLLFVLLLAPFLFCYIGGQYGFISYLNTYATLNLRFSKDTAAYLNSAFWASFVVGRLCGILCSLKLSPHKMIFWNLVGCIASLVLLLVCNKLPLIIWVGSIAFAFSIASIYSSAITYVERHITMTGARMSILTVTAALGDATIPLLVGISIRSTFFGYPNFIILVLSIVVLASIIFALNVLCITQSYGSFDTDVKVKCNT